MNTPNQTSSGKSLLKVIFVIIFLTLLVYLANNLYQKQVAQRKIQNVIQIEAKQSENPARPVRLKIPSINVDASIEHVGVASNGEMEVPTNIAEVGWFKLGPLPGEKGSAVLAGHFNGKNGEAGVFAELSKLKVGDELSIEDSTGKSITFTVRESRNYFPGYADEVFGQSDNAYLNLITCDGIWDSVKKTYSKRLVVFADIKK